MNNSVDRDVSQNFHLKVAQITSSLQTRSSYPGVRPEGFVVNVRCSQRAGGRGELPVGDHAELVAQLHQTRLGCVWCGFSGAFIADSVAFLSRGFRLTSLRIRCEIGIS